MRRRGAGARARARKLSEVLRKVRRGSSSAVGERAVGFEEGAAVREAQGLLWGLVSVGAVLGWSGWGGVHVAVWS